MRLEQFREAAVSSEAQFDRQAAAMDRFWKVVVSQMKCFASMPACVPRGAVPHACRCEGLQGLWTCTADVLCEQFYLCNWAAGPGNAEGSDLIKKLFWPMCMAAGSWEVQRGPDLLVP